jgi:hypothetical protein
MKTKRQVFILLVVVLAGILTLSAQNRKEQRAEVVRNIISSKMIDSFCELKQTLKTDYGGHLHPSI